MARLRPTGGPCYILPMVADDADSFTLFLELYGGLPRAAPGSDAATRRALALLPSGDRRAVLDLGCGPGAQTLSLADGLPEADIVALDILPMMVAETRRRCRRAGLGDRVVATVADMARPPVAPATCDLLWCEGAIYVLGVEAGLRLWRPLLAPGGCVVFSDALWLQPEPPGEVLDWWLGEYPAITGARGIRHAVESAGFEVIASFTLAEDDWWEGYYRPLEATIPRFLARHPDNQAAAAVAEGAAVEISMLRRFAAWYGYAFFVARPRQ